MPFIDLCPPIACISIYYVLRPFAFFLFMTVSGFFLKNLDHSPQSFCMGFQILLCVYSWLRIVLDPCTLRTLSNFQYQTLILVDHLFTNDS
ncbi:hypothetical protein J3R30DRAFT_3540250 [Lentinula aciculospora]|uniref:Uncharacterized protein n=1 Tax=Lentinula aciculospora TaxID=153920 RepID=A0A9W9DHY3_9AGAR|nr:hypothetical protein J3R30DRAFT_3540250 [Lentinula aciculospora]